MQSIKLEGLRPIWLIAVGFLSSCSGGALTPHDAIAPVMPDASQEHDPDSRPVGLPDQPPPPTRAGDVCAFPDDCDVPFVCTHVGATADVRSKLGYCTTLCDPNVPGTCGELSACVAVGDQRVCLSKCPTTAGAHCGPSTSCVYDAQSQSSLCRPLCERDEDCAPGSCNHATGLCDAAGTVASVIGANCAPGASGSCGGICVELAPTVYSCTALCRQGSYGTCDVCLPQSGAFKLADTGICFAKCDCNAQCGRPDMVCDPFTGMEFLQPTMFPFTQGRCLPRATAPSAGIAQCPSK